METVTVPTVEELAAQVADLQFRAAQLINEMQMTITALHLWAQLKQDGCTPS